MADPLVYTEKAEVRFLLRPFMEAGYKFPNSKVSFFLRSYIKKRRRKKNG
jgi:hypothetical protein